MTDDAPPPAPPPSPQLLPYIDDWRLIKDPRTESKYALTIICGNVFNHPKLADNTIIWTASVEWIQYKEAQTNTRVYLLGKMQPAFRNFLEDRTDPASTALLKYDTTTDRINI